MRDFQRQTDRQDWRCRGQSQGDLQLSDQAPQSPVVLSSRTAPTGPRSQDPVKLPKAFGPDPELLREPRDSAQGKARP